MQWLIAFKPTRKFGTARETIKRVGFGSEMSFAINQADNKPIPSHSQNGKKTKNPKPKMLKKGFSDV